MAGFKSRIKQQLLGPGGWAGGSALLTGHPLCLRLWVSFTLLPLLMSSSRLEASVGAGVPDSGLWSRCGAVGACLGGPEGVPMRLLGQALHGHLPHPGPLAISLQLVPGCRGHIGSRSPLLFLQRPPLCLLGPKGALDPRVSGSGWAQPHRGSSFPPGGL